MTLFSIRELSNLSSLSLSLLIYKMQHIHKKESSCDHLIKEHNTVSR